MRHFTLSAAIALVTLATAPLAHAEGFDGASQVRNVRLSSVVMGPQTAVAIDRSLAVNVNSSVFGDRVQDVEATTVVMGPQTAVAISRSTAANVNSSVAGSLTR